MADDKNWTAYKLSGTDGSRLAELAHVPEKSHERFRDLLAMHICETHFGTNNAGKPIRASDVSHSLIRVGAAARDLNKALGALIGEGCSFAKPGPSLAGMLLEIAIEGAVTNRRDITVGYLPRLTAYRHWVATLVDATAESNKQANNLFPRKRGRPPGAGGNPFFDNFVKRLHETAEMSGGKWTHYRARTTTGELKWNGTLMLALEILRPYLPSRSFSQLLILVAPLST